jgi:hypothetical protein
LPKARRGWTAQRFQALYSTAMSRKRGLAEC